MARIAFKTLVGVSYFGLAEDLLGSSRFAHNKGKVNLLLTSPPFPLNRKKKYGNYTEEEYLKWFTELGPVFADYLADDGSLVVELGNSWQQGSPTMSTLALRTLLSFLDKGKFHLCQQFVWFNTAKLPTPAPWVTRERIRVKDAFTNIWWMAKTERPKADNRRVLTDYSQKMTKLLKTGKYNSGRRPSEHKIGTKSFLKDNGGAIPLVRGNLGDAREAAVSAGILRYGPDKAISPNRERTELEEKLLSLGHDIPW